MSDKSKQTSIADEARKKQREYEKSLYMSKSLLGDEDKCINHPDHYTVVIETTDYIESWGMDFVEGNIIKYVSRYKYKRGVQDLKKAEWYLKRLIKKMETQEEEN